MIITPEEQQWIKGYLSNTSLQAELAAGTSKTIEPKPKTLIASGGRKKELFGEQKRTKELLKKWWNIYEQGGLYAQAIDMYSYATFANGYRFEGTENLVQEVEDNFRVFDFDTVGMHAIRQSLIFGDSFEEAVATRGNTSIPVSIVMRDSSTFDIDADEKGIVKGYIQILPDMPSTKLKPEQIIHLQLIPSGDLYGISLIGRAYDDIMRDTKTAEASAEAIDRHGFKKFHIQVGTEGELIDQTTIDKISKQFADITTKNEFTTSKDVSITDLDEGGLEKIEDYSNISLMRAAAALGLPEEVLGLRRGPLHPDTELLTKNGWVKIPDINIDDEILTLNPKTKNIEYQKIVNTFKYYVDEDLYHFKNNHIDVLCTYDHTVYMKPLHSDTFESIPASQVPGIFSFMVGGGNWKGEEKEFFEIPSMDIFVGDRWNGVSVKTRTQPAVKISMDIWLEFLGYYLSEGSTSTRKYEYRVDVHQNEGEGLQKIFECMKQLPFKIHLGKDEVRIYSKQLWSYLSLLGVQPIRYIPMEFKQLCSRQLNILYNALMFGDGAENGYYSSSKRLAEDVQELRIKLGFAANISCRDRRGQDVIVNGKKTGVARYLEYRVGLNNEMLYPELRRNSCKGHNQGVFLEHYVGLVHCVEVPNHIMLVRYNGKTCFIGNSTDATAVGRIELWLKSKISAIQRTVARTFTLQYIDRIVEPGQVRLVFNDVSEEDEFKKAQWIGALIGAYAKASPEALVEIEKVVPAKWVQKQFNILGEVVTPKVTNPITGK
jgi:hypothetical protein